MAIGKIKTLYTDTEKNEPLFPRTKTKAVTDSDGVGLDALLSNLAYAQEESDEIETSPIDSDTLGGLPADQYATKNFVKREVLFVQSGGEVDLDEYATKEEVANIDFPVDSVNGKTGVVQLSASDVGAYSDKGRLDGNIDTLSLDGTYWIETSKCTGTFPKEWGKYGFLHAFADYQKLVQYTDNGAGSSWERYYVNDKWYSWVLTGGAGKQDAITGLTPSMVMVCNSSGKITTSSSISTTELANLDGVTSNIQTQLDARYKVRNTINNKPESDIKDLNEVKNIGYYWVQCAGVANTPFGDNNSGKFGHLEYCGNGLQRFTQYGSTGIVAVYERDNVQTGWKAWKRTDPFAYQPKKGYTYKILNASGWYRAGKLCAYHTYRVSISTIYHNNADMAAIIDIALPYHHPAMSKLSGSTLTNFKAVNQVRLVKTASDASWFYLDFYYNTNLENEVYVCIDGYGDDSVDQYASYTLITDSTIDGTTEAILSLE